MMLNSSSAVRSMSRTSFMMLLTSSRSRPVLRSTMATLFLKALWVSVFGCLVAWG